MPTDHLSPPDALADALHDRYRLERELGRGGMAVVYLARDLRHDRPVALKVFRPEAAGALGVDRFEREIRVMAALLHPNILPLLDSGAAVVSRGSWVVSGAPTTLLYYTMPHVQGPSLRRRLEQEGRLPIAEALGLSREIADALAYAHERGVVHRDIKPENVLLSGYPARERDATSGWHALVADFGVARLIGAAAGDTRITGAGDAVGSPAYMSPEQLSGEPVDGRADVYALGCVLFEMLAGRPPFVGDNPIAVMFRRLAEPAPELGTLRPDVPAHVASAVRRALARDPKERFSGAAELARALVEPAAATATAPAASPSATHSAALVERDEFLETLERMRVSAVAGSGTVAVVSGEAGIGKTSLVEEFARTERGVRLLWGWCEALFTPRALGPLYDIAGQLGGELETALRNGAGRETIFSTVLDELGPGRPPTVLVLEDVHWADEATLDLLKFLGRRVSRLPLLLIVTTRDDELGPTHPLRAVLGDLPRGAVRRLELRALSKAAVERLARKAGRSPRGLYAATGGNPFYVSEILATSDPGIPATVRDAVLGRASRVSAEAREALETVSVIPGRVEPWLAERLLGRDSAGLEECLAAGMLVRDQQGVGFRHELARRAVDESLPKSRCRALHVRVLAALEAAPGPVAPARLVHHAEGAGDAAAVQRSVPLAASQASALGAHREAAAHYAAGLRFAEGLPLETRAALLEGRSYEAYLYGALAESVAAREEALAIRRRQGDHIGEGVALRWLSRLAWSSGRREDAERFAAEAVAALEPLGTGPELAMAYSNLSQLHMLANETGQAVEWGSKAIALAEALGDGEILVHALTNVGTAEVPTRPEDGYAKIARALRLAREAGYQEHVARCYANFTGLVADRQYAEAKPLIEEGLEYTEARDLDFWTMYLRSWHAVLAFDTGDWDTAEREARALLEREGAVPLPKINALCVLGRLRAARGEPGVEALLDEAKARADRAAEMQRLGPVAVARAEAAWLRGDLAAVAAAARPTYELALQKDTFWSRGMLALWLRRAGALERVPERIPAACALELAGEFAAAAAEWGRVGCPYEQALALGQSAGRAAVLEAERQLRAMGATAAAAAVGRGKS